MKALAEEDDPKNKEFWSALGGSENDVHAAVPDDDEVSAYGQITGGHIQHVCRIFIL